MNETIKKAYEIMEGPYKIDLPEVEIGKMYKLGDIWDGNGEVPEESYSYQLNNMDWINYSFDVVEEKESPLNTVIKITNIELL